MRNKIEDQCFVISLIESDSLKREREKKKEERREDENEQTDKQSLKCEKILVVEEIENDGRDVFSLFSISWK